MKLTYGLIVLAALLGWVFFGGFFVLDRWANAGVARAWAAIGCYVAVIVLLYVAAVLGTN